ncbi:MAG TPA: zf-HC2 domain-containing protein [Acidimicrobiia bacterium]|nr:zf-HC2 domain-containing protein [Acidimicrobiia bacterium]
MSHRPELLSALLDGEVSAEEAAWVATHLEECGECRAELDDLADARSAVRSLPMLDLPVLVGDSHDVVTPIRRRRLVTTITSVAAAAVVAVGALGVLGLAADAETPVDAAEAEAILAATTSLGVVDDGSDVARLLVGGGEVRYRARQTNACLDGTASVGVTVDVTKFGNVTVMADPLSGLTVVGPGSKSTGPVEGPIETVSVDGSAATLGDYEVTGEQTDEHRGRPARVVTIGRDGIDRARLWVDDDTGVVLQREWLAADGTVTCLFELVEFEPSQTIVASIPFDMRAEERRVVYESVGTDLPSEVGGLALVSAYMVEGGVVGVYGDGLFTVAVARIDGGAPDVVSESTLPAVTWQSDGSAWTIVGALPDDLMTAVRSALPAPTSPNPFVDGWRILFG